MAAYQVFICFYFNESYHYIEHVLRKKNRKETLRCHKSRVGPDHPRSHVPVVKAVMCGGVLDAVNDAKFRQNRLRVFGSTSRHEVLVGQAS